MKKTFVFMMSLCGLLPILSHAVGEFNVQIREPQKARYSFEAWPLGATEPIRFVSSIYLNDSGAYVRLNEGMFSSDDDSKIRTPADFDSLRAAKHVVRGVVLHQAPVWYKAAVAGRRWGFPRLTGKISLYSGEPGRASYAFMDTGAGLVPYAEDAVRAKIAGNPASAKLLKKEKIGHAMFWTLASVGGGLAAGGLVANIAGADGAKSSQIALLGVGIAAVSWIPHIVVQGKYEEAIRAYNAGAGE